MELDLLIKGGTVVDGSGAPRYKADVGAKDGRIIFLGQAPDDWRSAKVIPAEGKSVLPGFIDIHSHSDFVLSAANHEDTLACFLRQGITTLVTGNCGFGPAPVVEDHRAELQSYTAFLRSEDSLPRWRSYADYLDLLQRQGVALNVVPLAAHGAIRIAVMGFAKREPDHEERRKMEYWLDEALAAGAFGMSAGLAYAPGMYATTNEIINLARRLRRGDDLFTCHSRGLSETLVEAAEEVVDVGRYADVRAQFSHLCALGEANWPLIGRAIEALDHARHNGTDIATDCQAYIAGNTTLTALLPPWALEGGIDQLIVRLSEPEGRAAIRYTVENGQPQWPIAPGEWTDNMIQSLGYENIWLLWLALPRNKEFEGKSLADLAEVRGGDPFDATMNLIVEERGQSMMLVVGSAGSMRSDAPLRSILSLPYTSLETDAIVTGRGKPNRGAFGAYPRVLGHYVRDEGLLSLERAVHQMTGLAADRLGLTDVGRIRPGAAADIVIVDPETVSDNTTYFDSTVTPTGIEQVVLNGRVALESGQLQPGRHGVVYRKRHVD